jgi:hypothetical protein
MLKQLLQEEDIQKWAFGTTIAAMKAEIRDTETKSQEVYIKGMKTELNNLRDRTLYFGSYKPENIEMATGILADDVHKAIMEYAPTLYSLLKTLSHDRRTESPQTESRITTIFQILCFNRNQRKSNFFPAVMGLVMHSRGVSKPVFKVLNAMGITESYDSAMESIEGLRSHAMDAIHGFAKSLRWLIAYDNLDVTVDTHEQTVGSQVSIPSLYLIIYLTEY